jgi:hypothetical protein
MRVFFYPIIYGKGRKVENDVRCSNPRKHNAFKEDFESLYRQKQKIKTFENDTTVFPQICRFCLELIKIPFLYDSNSDVLSL